MATINEYGQCSVVRDQEVIQANVQLSVGSLSCLQSCAPLYLDGQPCIAVCGHGDRSGVFILHAVTLYELRFSRSMIVSGVLSQTSHLQSCSLGATQVLAIISLSFMISIHVCFNHRYLFNISSLHCLAAAILSTPISCYFISSLGIDDVRRWIFS